MIPLFRSFPTSSASSSAHFVCHVWHVSVFARVVNFVCFRLPVRSMLSEWSRSSATQVVLAHMFDAEAAILHHFIQAVASDMPYIEINRDCFQTSDFVHVCLSHFHRVQCIWECSVNASNSGGSFRSGAAQMFRAMTVALDSLSISSGDHVVQMSSIACFRDCFQLRIGRSLSMSFFHDRLSLSDFLQISECHSS